jgi:uncharacterized protein (TIRG00374 family)
VPALQADARSGAGGPEGPRARPRGWLRRAIAIAVALALCALVFRGVDWHGLLAELGHADLRLVGLAILLNLTLNSWARAARWRCLLGPLPHQGRAPGVVELAMLLFASQTVSTLLPARAGDALRVIEPRRRHGYSVGGLVAVHLVEKLLEVVVFALAAAAVAVALGDAAPPAVRRALWIFAAAVAAAVPLAWWLSIASPRAGGVRAALGRGAGRLSPRLAAGLSGFLLRLGEALALLRAPRVWGRALAFSVLNDVADACMIGACLAAVGLHPPVAASFLALIALNVAITFPSTPGQLGVLEAGVVVALTALGAEKGAALAAALLYHASHLVPVTLLGLVELARMGSGATASPAAADEP